MHPLFESLPVAHRERYLRQIVQKNYARGNVIFHQGAKVNGLYIIDDGLVQFQIEGLAGKSTFIGIAKRGIYLGDCEMLGGMQHFAVATAMTECRVSLLPAQYFEQAMEEFPTFSRAIASRLAKSLYLLQMVQVARHQLSAEQNLPGIIIYLARHFGVQLAEDSYRVDVELSQDQLAHMAGLTRQTIHKPLQQWKEQGWLDYRYGRMVVNQLQPFMDLLDNISFQDA